MLVLAHVIYDAIFFPKKSGLRGWGCAVHSFHFKFLNSMQQQWHGNGICVREILNRVLYNVEREGGIVGYRVKNYREIIIVGSLKLCFMQLIFYD